MVVLEVEGIVFRSVKGAFLLFCLMWPNVYLVLKENQFLEASVPCFNLQKCVLFNLKMHF